jgi:hypothetical protein
MYDRTADTNYCVLQYAAVAIGYLFPIKWNVAERDGMK